MNGIAVGSVRSTNVKPGARAALLRKERAKFLKEEWPSLAKRLQRLELDLKSLFAPD